jgi:hypothetical protein
MKLFNPVTDYLRRSDYRFTQSVVPYSISGASVNTSGVRIDAAFEGAFFMFTLLPDPYILLSLEIVLLNLVSPCNLNLIGQFGNDDEEISNTQQEVLGYSLTSPVTSPRLYRFDVTTVLTDLSGLSPLDHVSIMLYGSSTSPVTDIVVRDLIATYRID